MSTRGHTESLRRGLLDLDAVEYLKTLARMHNKQADCAHCVLPNGCDITKDAGEIKKRVEIVEKWGKEKPYRDPSDEIFRDVSASGNNRWGAVFLPEQFRPGLQGRKKLQEYLLRRMPRRILV